MLLAEWCCPGDVRECGKPVTRAGGHAELADRLRITAMNLCPFGLRWVWATATRSMTVLVWLRLAVVDDFARVRA